MNYPRKGRKRLAVDIFDAIHDAIKVQAKKRAISMQLWVSRAIIRQLIQEGHVFNIAPQRTTNETNALDIEQDEKQQ